MLEGTLEWDRLSILAGAELANTHIGRTWIVKGTQRTHLYSSAKKMSRPWSSSNSAVKDKQSDNPEHTLLSLISFLLFWLHSKLSDSLLMVTGFRDVNKTQDDV